ncbi:MAG: hypothetical protein WD489_09950 [Rhodovibrionaceae bacterium]
MSFLILAAALLVFLASLKLTGVVGHVEEAAADARRVTTVLGAAEIDDARKEAAARQAALAMFGAFLAIFLRSLLAFGLPLALVAVCVSLDIASRDAIEAAATDIYALIGATLVAVLAWRYLK